MHCGCKWLVKVDVMQFFESISERQVYRVFLRLGYEPLVAFEAARVCTRLTNTGRRFTRHRWRNIFAPTRYSIEHYRSARVGNLPQGAPTSPMLSNLVVWHLDEELTQLAAVKGMVYTRYADDLLFSTASAQYSRPGSSKLDSERLRRAARTPVARTIPASATDQRIANTKLTPEQRKTIAEAKDINNSDVDLCEYKGRTIIYYSWGNQQGKEFLAESIYDGTLASFLKGWFP